MNRIEKDSWLLTRPIAHRGLHDRSRGIPENSMGAFQAAMDAGYPIELDIQMTADGELFVLHDWDLLRMTGIQRMSAALHSRELKRIALMDTEHTIPRLEEVLDLVRGRVPLLIEVKNRRSPAGRLERRLCTRMREYDGEFAVQSFNPFTVRFMRRNLPETPVGQLSDDYSGKKEIPWALRDALTNCRFNLWTRPDFISYNVRKMKDPRPFLTPLHRGGRTVVLGWTVSDERTKARAEIHCDNMIFEGIRP